VTAPLLRVEGVDVRFGGVTALAGVDLAVAPGEIAGLIGPNGAGKTTLFNVASGFVRPTAGRVVFDGRDLTRLPPHQIAAAGLVRTFQKTSVFAGVPAAENVRMGLHLAGRCGPLAAMLGLPRAAAEERALDARAAEILEFVGLGPRRDVPAGSLAYGEQRLLEIAVALGAAPRLLLLDEPAAGLNPTEKQALAGLVRRIRGLGITVLLVDHDIRLVMGLSDRVTVLHHGKALCCDEPAAVQSNEAVIRAYLGAQPTPEEVPRAGA
jgi:branched-chain amino acid transport system ATP-binding protein